ncbi:hypothetical protein B0H10DRAFT_5994 [Mycena sp. CBHHK59/15]|nr:hypothetical protein B0H10DRAFT_5994 [Mycena sp. CBHHK59/15]
MSSTSQSATQESPTSTHTQIAVFNAFAFLGLLWLSAVLITAAASRAIQRSKAWFAHLGAWATFSFSCLFIVGRQTGPEPPYTVCLFQAGMIYACPPLTGVSGFCFLLDIYLGLSAVLFKRKINPLWSSFLATFPYLFSICIFIRTILFVEDPSTVQRHISHLYCHITTPTDALVSGILVIVSGTLLLCLEAWIIIILHKNWMDFRYLSKSGPQYALSIFIRFGLFTIVYSFGVGLGTFTVSVGNVSFPYWSVLLPTVPIFAALAFGSQMDILQVWMFWRPSTGAATGERGSAEVV